MSQKKKKKKAQSESSKKTVILNKLQRFEAFSPDSAKTLKELGINDPKRYERHLEALEGDKIIKKEGSTDNARYWAVKDKIKPKKSSNTPMFIFFWLGSTVIIFLLVYLLFQPH